MVRRAALVAIVAGALLLSRCGASSNPTAPAISPSAAPPPAYLVLFFRSENPTASSKLEIVDLRGKLVASADFNAPSPTWPSMSCGVVIPPAVRVAAGAAYFVDSVGVVHGLGPTGATSVVTTLKLPGPQPIISYAVSPDGKQVMAIVINETDQGGTLDLENATAGSSATIAFHRTLTPGQGATEIVGWDSVGPTATLNSRLCVQQDPLALEYKGDALVHLAPDGAHLDQIGGPDCIPWDEVMDGAVLCGALDWRFFTVRTKDGVQLWSGYDGWPSGPRLAPGGKAIAFNADSADGHTTVVVTPENTQTASFARAMGPSYSFLGWAGNTQVVVVSQDRHIGLLSASGPVTFTDLGIQAPSHGVSLAGTIGI